MSDSARNQPAKLRGSYIAWGGWEYFWNNGRRSKRRDFQAIPLTTWDYPIPAHESTGTSYSLDLKKGGLTNPKQSTSYYRDSVRLEAIGSDWRQLEDLRVIPPSDQEYLAELDGMIKEARDRIRGLEKNKSDYVANNFLSWEIAKFEDIIPEAELKQIQAENEAKRKAREAKGK